jgi:AraC-like DNA-binding protein
MNKLLQELLQLLLAFSPADGFHETPVPGVHCIKVSKAARRSKDRWRASLSIVVQGAKEIVLGRKIFRMTAGQYVATPIQLPVISRVAAAARDRPFLCLLIHMDPLTISEVSARLRRESTRQQLNPVRAMFSGEASERMLEAAVRLVRLFRTPEDAPVLGALVVKEILYLLMNGPEGAAIRQFVHSGSKMHQISHAIHALESELEKEVDVPLLAKTANMSRSAFFKHFKQVTALSPIQYQKRLRLHEARRLMLERGDSAESSCFKVGYKSASQFSREYSRMFGIPPARDAAKMKSSRPASWPTSAPAL